jgi:hypothetical protein
MASPPPRRSTHKQTEHTAEDVKSNVKRAGGGAHSELDFLQVRIRKEESGMARWSKPTVAQNAGPRVSSRLSSSPSAPPGSAPPGSGLPLSAAEAFEEKRRDAACSIQKKFKDHWESQNKEEAMMGRTFDGFDFD